MKVYVQKLADVAVLRVHGRIVIGETARLRNAVSYQSNASVLVLDLAKVDYIDAHGLGMLLGVRKYCELRGIEFRIMNVSNLVEQVLQITRLITVFDVASERDLIDLSQLSLYLK